MDSTKIASNIKDSRDKPLAKSETISVLALNKSDSVPVAAFNSGI